MGARRAGDADRGTEVEGGEMSERELLELAAKAAGVHAHHWFDQGCVLMCSNVEGGDPDYGWNPLVDDGDALRLAVKLGLGYTTILEIGVGGADCALNRPQVYAHERHDGGADPYASTRRAIVRAAAEIGRTM